MRFEQTNSLLDPEVARGTDFVPNVLKVLGASEDIIKNPYAVDLIERQFFKVADQAGTVMPHMFEKPTTQRISDFATAVESCPFLSSDTREIDYKNVSLKSSLGMKYGISIDKETGCVLMNMFSTAGKENNAYYSSNFYKEAIFSADGTGDVIIADRFCKITDEHKEELSCSSTYSVNKFGVTMKSEDRSFEQVDGQSVETFHCVSTRDEQYPFIEKQEISVNEISLDKFTGTRYLPINRNDLSQLGCPEYEKTEEEAAETPISFGTRAEVDEYFEANKEELADVITYRYPDPGIFATNTLREALKQGVSQLANEAGILPSPTQDVDTGIAQ